MTNDFRIASSTLGPGQPVYVVAEMSANHGRDFDRAVRLVRAAKAAGADAVKLQTYTPDTMTIRSQEDAFRIDGGTPWDGRTLYELYGAAHAPWEWHPRLKAVADEVGIDLFSTAFDATSVDFLERMGVPLHKVASFELVDIPLIETIACTGKPMILSTGMATVAEIDEAIRAARRAGAKQIALLKCTSAYPAPPDAMNLRAIPHMAERFRLPVGLSDHTQGTAVAAAAVALGACIVEKHLTLSRAIPGPDSAFSLEPAEFAEMVRSIRIVERALGAVRYGEGAEEARSRLYRRSLFVVEDVAAGEELTSRNVRSIRPGHGLHPRFLRAVLGQPAARALARGTPLAWDMVAGADAGAALAAHA